MSTKGNSQPSLLALLICERVILDDDKVATLMRVIDTFNNVIEAHVPPDKELTDVPPVEINCEVFTRWGIGEGTFREELAVVVPSGEELLERTAIEFTKPSGFHFQQTRIRIRFQTSKAGIYKFRVYLNGEIMGEHPFRVNIDVQLAN